MLFEKYDEVTIHPLKYLLVFLIITEVLFFLGPIDYEVRKPCLMAFYFAVVNIALYHGYTSAIKRFRPSSCSIGVSAIQLLLLLGLFLQVEYMIQKWASHGLSFSLQSLLMALTNPGDAYKGESLSTINTNLITDVFLSPFRWAAIPLGVCSWNRLKKFFKFVVILTGVVYVFTWLGIGTRKGLMDLILMLYFLIIAAHPSILRDSIKRKKLKTVAISLLVLFILFFVFSNLSRGGMAKFIDLKDLRINHYRSFYAKYFSPNVLAALSEITSYLCQGYCALNIAISDIGIIPPTFGGSSMLLWLWFERFFGYNPMPDTYMAILESKYGIGMYECWHSIYLWWANDVTFIGVPFVIYLIGRYLCRTWMDCVANQNPFSFPMCAFMIIMVFYFFANNQVFSFSLEAFVLTVFIYKFSKNVTTRC